jgi:hypothetical protein
MTEHAKIIAQAERLAAAIGSRDIEAVRELLAPGFVHRSHGGGAVDAPKFLEALRAVPGEILSITIEQIAVDITAAGALVTGVQHARVRVGGNTVDDRRRFIDWFVTVGDEWRIQAAVDVPEQVTT